mmetsp:Transcript_4223/g.14131  ORF Transcript_4223/g.14131 Transcript_4223/m.14131 type:complete len:272 (-) Transcript_4223:189-1004(-)
MRGPVQGLAREAEQTRPAKRLELRGDGPRVRRLAPLAEPERRGATPVDRGALGPVVLDVLPQLAEGQVDAVREAPPVARHVQGPGRARRVVAAHAQRGGRIRGPGLGEQPGDLQHVAHAVQGAQRAEGLRLEALRDRQGQELPAEGHGARGVDEAAQGRRIAREALRQGRADDGPPAERPGLAAPEVVQVPGEHHIHGVAHKVHHVVRAAQVVCQARGDAVTCVLHAPRGAARVARGVPGAVKVRVRVILTVHDAERAQELHGGDGPGLVV